MSDRVQQPRGLPATFSLQVPHRARAASLGDYLDDKPPTVTPQSPPARESGAVVEDRRPSVTSTASEMAEPRLPRPRRRTPAPPRKQVNMKPQTLQRAEELVQLFRTHGPQRDAGASELFQAIIDVVYDARAEIQFDRLIRRGRWGTDKARAASEVLRDVIEDAIVTASGRR